MTKCEYCDDNGFVVKWARGDSRRYKEFCEHCRGIAVNTEAIFYLHDGIIRILDEECSHYEDVDDAKCYHAMLYARGRIKQKIDEYYKTKGSLI